MIEIPIPDDLLIPDLSYDYDWMSQAFRTPARHLQITAHFDGPHPDVVYPFAQFYDWERLATRDAEDTILVPADGRVSASFRNLHSGLHSGFSWRRPV